MREHGFLLGSCSLVRICPAWLQYPAFGGGGSGGEACSLDGPAPAARAKGLVRNGQEVPAWVRVTCGQGVPAGLRVTCGQEVPAGLRATCGGQLFSLRICQACARLPGLLMEEAREAGAGPLMVQRLRLAPQGWSGWPVSLMHGA